MKCFLLIPIYGKALPTLESDEWLPNSYIVGWERKDTGEIKKHVDMFGPGAMWYATWIPKNFTWTNETEPHLHVCCPNNRVWDIDSRCSNCDMKTDTVHRCWIRHGTPPQITVDKAGRTCNAGAGSIQAGDYHGFLRMGSFSST